MMTSPEGSRCIRCGPGEYRGGQTITGTREREDLTLIVKDVPAAVCWACGESLMTEETAKRLEDMLRKAQLQNAETVVRHFSKEPVEA